MVNFFINDKNVEASSEDTIWTVAKKNGIILPHLCFADKPGYRADGNCRACMVSIEGEEVLAASCIRKPTEGMKVFTEDEKSTKSREMVLELLVTDQPKKKIVTIQILIFGKWLIKLTFLKADSIKEKTKKYHLQIILMLQWRLILMHVYTVTYV